MTGQGVEGDQDEEQLEEDHLGDNLRAKWRKEPHQATP